MSKKKKSTKPAPPVKRSFIERVGVANLIGYVVAAVIVLGYLIHSLTTFLQ